MLRELGRGGMGVVYEARHPELPRSVALKQIQADRASPTALARFLREAEVLARLRHPSIVTIHELSTAPQGPYMVEELIEGRTLSRAAREGLSFEQAARIVRDLADALEAVHRAGIVHRDVKPANAMLRPDGRAVLLDFGLARDVNAERLTRTHEVSGTVVYMPPEQAEGGTARLDGRADVYSAGAVLYELLVGRPPFRGPVPQVLREVLETEPSWPRAERRDVPAGLDAICRRAMARGLDRRYPSAAALRDDLERWLAGKTPLALRAARRRWLLPLLPLALAVALAGPWLLRTGPRPIEASSPGAPPPSARLASPPRAPEEQPAWELLGPLQYRLTMAERTIQGEFQLEAALKLQQPRRDRDRALYTCQVARIELRSTGADPWTWASGDDPAHPMAALGEVVGRPFGCRIDLASGEVGLEGFPEISRRVLAAIPEYARTSAPARMIERLLTDEFMSGCMDALVHRRRNPRVPWTCRDGAWSADVRDGLPAILPLTVERSGDDRYRLQATATWSDGSVAVAAIEQVRVTPGEPVATRWSMERVD